MVCPKGGTRLIQHPLSALRARKWEETESKTYYSLILAYSHPLGDFDKVANNVQQLVPRGVGVFRHVSGHDVSYSRTQVSY